MVGSSSFLVLEYLIPPLVDDDLIPVLAFLVIVRRYPSCETLQENRHCRAGYVAELVVVVQQFVGVAGVVELVGYN